MDTLVRLQAKMKHDNIPAILVMADEQRFYLSGFKSSAGFMMIFPDEAFLYTDSRYFEAAKQRAKGLSYEVRLHKGRMSEHIKTVMADKHLDTLYFEDDLISFANHRAHDGPRRRNL